MECSLDNVWATPSTLHGRVTVWGPGHRWRHRYDVSMALDEIPVEAIQGLLDRYLDTEPPEPDDIPLFELG